jgi:hypothetical protein
MSVHRARQFCLTIQSTWTSPLRALAVGVGDCKQYAVLKHAVLQEAGFAPDDLRLVVVRIKSLRNNHAVVAVRQSAHWFILDNRILPVVESSKLLDYYVPLFAPDDRGVREFLILPGAKGRRPVPMKQGNDADCFQELIANTASSTMPWSRVRCPRCSAFRAAGPGRGAGRQVD